VLEDEDVSSDAALGIQWLISTLVVAESFCEYGVLGVDVAREAHAIYCILRHAWRILPS